MSVLVGHSRFDMMSELDRLLTAYEAAVAACTGRLYDLTSLSGTYYEVLTRAYKARDDAKAAVLEHVKDMVDTVNAPSD